MPAREGHLSATHESSADSSTLCGLLAEAVREVDHNATTMDTRLRQHEPLSPELVLVSPPELADRARAALSERPWEDLVQVRPAGKDLASPFAIMERLSEVPAPPPAPPYWRSLPRTASYVGFAALVALAALVGVKAFIPDSSSTLTQALPNRTSATPAPARSPRAAHTDASRSGRSGRSKPRSGRRHTAPVVGSGTSGASKPRTKLKPAHSRAAQPSVPAHPVPSAVEGGGYVFGSNQLFRVSADGRFVTRFSVQAKCSPAVDVPAMKSGSKRTCTFAGQVQGDPRQRVTVALDGRFVTARRAVGRIRIRSEGCDTGTIVFSASLG